MIINRESWHYRVFAFMAKVSKRMFSFLDFKEDYRASIDLCTYIRTILVTGPLVLALTVAMWSWVIYVFLVLPFTYDDFKLWHIIGMTIIGLLVLVLLVGHIVFFIAEFFRKRKERREEAYAKLSPSEAYEKFLETKKPGFASIAWSNVKGIKSRYCPVFEVE